MELKCVVAAIAGLGGSRRKLVMLITEPEEARVAEALRDRRDGSEILLAAHLPEGSDQAAAERQMREIEALLRGAAALVVSAHREAAHSTRLAELACCSHLAGLRVISIESALLELDPSVPAHGAELVRRIGLCGTHQGLAHRFYAGLKDSLEPVLALGLLVLLSPLVLLVALAVKLTSPGPVFYRQTRVGLNRKLFDIIKFRSMRIDAEKDGPKWAAASRTDARLTPIGGFLRATHLDEIPQIWNVVRGELSFVGPRPERPVFCQEIEEYCPLFRLRTLIKPGITGWAQVHSGYANSIDDSKRKLEFDLFYILKHSLLLDARIVAETVAVLFLGGSEGRKRERAAPARPRLSRKPAPTLPGLSRRPGVLAEKQDLAQGQ